MGQKRVGAAEAADDLKHGTAIAGRDVRRVILSLETTGLEPDDRVIEIGCVEMIGRKLTGRIFHDYINPEREIHWGATAVHGISDELVADKPKFRDIATEFVDLVRGAELVMHNAEFDATYLNYELALLKLPPLETVVAGVVDTLKMARAIRPGLKNNINALCADYQLVIPRRQYHGALLDAHMLAKIYLAMTRNKQEFSTMSLLEQIELRWAEVQKNGYMGDKWAKTLVDSQENLLKAAKTFHQWAPLNVYLSVARAAKPRITFSLRYQGQHVANLLVDLLADRSPQLEIDKNTAKTNKSYFEIDQEGSFGWRGTEAKEFRKHFKNRGPEPRGRSEEHRIEAIFLEQMADSTSEKFNGTLKNIQPVLIAGCPFQLPVPISGNTGKPVEKRGNIDIVARRRVGNRTRLSIWELKRPGVTAHAIEQAYIYGVTVLKMLRAKESGHIWYKEVLGFNGKMPDKLTIECVVAVSLKDIKMAEAFLGKLRRFVTENSLQVEGDTIEFYLAIYTEKQGSLSIDLTKV